MYSREDLKQTQMPFNIPVYLLKELNVYVKLLSEQRQIQMSRNKVIQELILKELGLKEHKLPKKYVDPDLDLRHVVTEQVPHRAVRRCVELWKKGYNTKEIFKILNKEGLRTPRSGNKWNRQNVQLTLRSTSERFTKLQDKLTELDPEYEKLFKKIKRKDKAVKKKRTYKKKTKESIENPKDDV